MAVKVSDLKDQIGTSDRTILYCGCCGGEYSANKGDYFMYKKDHVFKCCDNDMMLMKKNIVYTLVKS